MSRKIKKLSIIVPLLNEAEVLEEFHQSLIQSLSDIKEWEVIYIDDGSSDETFTKLEALHKSSSNVKVLRLSRNFGQNMALMAGIKYANGNAIVCIDGDLQHPPVLIPKMVKLWENGADIVLPVATNWRSFGGYKCRNIIYPVLCKVVEYFPKANAKGFFRLFDAEVAEALKQMSERPDFLRGMLSWTGFSTEEIEYELNKRAGGESKWTTAAQINKGIGSLCAFSLLPTRLVFLVGSVLLTISLLLGLFVGAFSGLSALQWVLLALSFFSGLILMAIGTIGEYIGRAYHHGLQRPNYIISKKLGLA